MTNVDMKVEGNLLVIRVDLDKNFGRSASGKTTIIASTQGNQAVPYKDKVVNVGLNVYKK